MKNRDNPQDVSIANEIAVQGLAFLAEDIDRLGRFLALSGLDPATSREAAREPGFLAGVLDHIMGDESLLVAFAAGNQLRPQQIVEARNILAGPSVH
jgi:hypothetical protein